MRDVTGVVTMMDYRRRELYESLRRPVDQATTLLPDAYHDAEFFAQERERVWQNSWIAVGYTSQIPAVGDILPVEVAGEPLVVVKSRSGRIRAFHNVCRHRGSRLVDEPCNSKVIRCPYHGWGYSLDGTLLGTPYFQGLDVPRGLADKFRMASAVEETFRKEDHPLFEVAAETWGGILFVNLNPRPFPFAEWLGDLPIRFARHPLDELTLVRRRSFEIKANWKLIAENFTEYYHLPFGHPELCNVSGFDNHWRYQGPGMYTGMCTSPLTDDPDTVSFEGLPAWDRLTYTESRSAYFVLLFPNIALWIFPHHLLTLLFRPASEGLTLESLDMLVHPQALENPGLPATLDRIMSFWGFVNEQDVKLVERVQDGLRSRRYGGGRMCFRFEEPVHRFQNMVADLMTGEPRVRPGDPREEAPTLEPVST